MVIHVILKNGKVLFEEIRAVEVKKDEIIYYRANHYTNDEQEICIGDIKWAEVIIHGNNRVLVDS